MDLFSIRVKSLVAQEQQLSSYINVAIKNSVQVFGEGLIGLLEISVDPVLSFLPRLLAWLL